MADNRANRKSKRNFSLEKPVERRFDIEKDVDAVSEVSAKPVPAKPTPPNQQAVKPVQGSSDISKESITKSGGNVPPIGPNGGDDNNDGGNGSKKWIIIALIVAALAACAYFFMRSNKSDEVADPETPLLEQNDSTQNEDNASNDSKVNAAIDSTANTANVPEENASANNGDVVDDTATDQNVDKESEGASTSQDTEDKQSTSTTNSQPTSDSPTNKSEVSSQLNSSSSSIEQKAKDVWKGVYGNNPDRRRNLGADFEAVQKLVNEMSHQRLK